MVQLCLVFALALAWAAPLHQGAREPLRTSTTVREALLRSGFDDGVLASQPPDLDRRLTSSSFAATEDVFIAGYYFDDEVEDSTLGPLHVSRFERATRRWTHAPLFRGDDRGSVIEVQAGSRVLVEMHASPSASHTLVLDSRTLHVLTIVYGFQSRVMADGSTRFIGSMVHFAPTHQEKLMLLDATDGRTIEVFPGTYRSVLADAYRRTIRAAYARVPGSARAKYEHSGYGPIDDFDRSFVAIADTRGTRIAFVAVYDCGRCYDGLEVPPMPTAVVCDRNARPEGRAYDGQDAGPAVRSGARGQDAGPAVRSGARGQDAGPAVRSGAGTWSCDERPLDEAARELGVRTETNSAGRYGEHALDALVAAMLKKR